ncbi:MAG: hypothetical protein WA791_09410 [Rhodomicrobium sp.]
MSRASRMVSPLSLWLVIAAVLQMPAGSALAGERAAISLKGRVLPACTIQNAHPMIEFGEISMAGSATVSLLVSCNAPFRFALTSLNGGLAQTAGVKVKPPFLSLLPYSLTYRLPTSAGFLIDTCSSSNMSATGGACAGRSVDGTLSVSQVATIGFSWDPHGLVPAAGAYRDILLLTVSAGF